MTFSHNNILFLLSDLGIGGSERKTLRVANELRRRGIGIHIAYLNRPHALRKAFLPSIPLVCLRRNGKFSIIVILRLMKYLKNKNINHVIAINLYPLLYAYLVRTLFGTRKFSLWTAVNTTEFHTLYERLKMIIYAPMLRSCQGVIFGCYKQKSLWVKKYRIPPDLATVIYNGVDARDFSPHARQFDKHHFKQQYEICEDEIIIGTVGQLRPEKQQADLIKASAQLIHIGFKVKLLIVGAGSEDLSLRKLAQNLGIAKQVIFTGQLEDVWPALSITDIFALTSVAVETFSNAALEAMSMGIPVVMSDVGGANEMIKSGVNGFIFEKHDINGLITHLKKLAENNKLRAELGRNAQASIKSKFRFMQMVDKYQALCIGGQRNYIY